MTTTTTVCSRSRRDSNARPLASEAGASPLPYISTTERTFPLSPHFAGFGPHSDRVLSAEYHRLTHAKAQDRHATSEG